jgi:hypothetical protein
MRTNLLQLEQRVRELEALADEVGTLAEQLTANRNAQPALTRKGQAWFRGAREFLVQQGSSALAEFEACYIRYLDTRPVGGAGIIRSIFDIESYLNRCLGKGEQIPDVKAFNEFMKEFQKARALLQSAVEEVKSKELPVVTELSFDLSADEFDKADELLSQASGDDAIIRAAAVVARVALERHLFTVADRRSILVLGPKGKPMAGDAINALKKANVINAIQKSELDSLFTVANHCAHPKESVLERDVSRLIQRGKELASVIL